ncbi:MAG: hypothetical protein GDA56_23120 [Hormoscilla sp. GM7CHS1pb]|nr:hypothetical protein [Hormoscilla sp. GM7CHS1pb]
MIDDTVRKLADARLLVTSELSRGKGAEPIRVVDVAHEALIRNWSRLRGWVKDNREAIRIERQIKSDADAWLHKEKSQDYCFRGRG